MAEFDPLPGSWALYSGGTSADPAHPVSCIDYFDALACLAWISEVDGNGPDYRLPTWAEWGYAASSGTSTPYFWGEDPEAACRYANVGDASNGYSFPDFQLLECDDGVSGVGEVATSANDVRLPKAFGIYDMLGSVAEWVSQCGEGPSLSQQEDLASGQVAGSRLNLGLTDSLARVNRLRELDAPCGVPSIDRVPLLMVSGGAYSSSYSGFRVDSFVPVPVDFRAAEVGFRPARSINLDQ